MLNIGKLGAGGAEYYLDTVAAGPEGYYLGQREAPGAWLDGAGALGLAGEVAAEDLRAVLAGRHPGTGAVLGRAGRRVPGFDLTFRPPKSVSLLWGLGGAQVGAEVRAAHDEAVGQALGYLGQVAGFSRRGRGGSQPVRVEGLVAAAFVHRTSRAGDPLLHTHVLVANLARAVDDGVWRSLDARRLYAHAKTAGFLYQAVVRHELTRRLGLAWGPVRQGTAEVAGVPDALITAFSQRRMQIAARLAQRGESSQQAARVATLTTRPRKQPCPGADLLHDGWRRRAAAVGFDAARLGAVLGRGGPHRPDHPGWEQLAARVLGAEGVTARASSFGRRDLVQALCAALPAGAPAADILAVAERILAPEQGLVVRLHTDPRGEARYSTPELLGVEHDLIDSALARQDATVGVAAEAAIAAALGRRPTLGADQAGMVRRLCADGVGVAVVVGKAGTGKTFALDAAREAWQAAGWPVLGCALAARAAAELQAGAGIPSATVAARLAEWDRAGIPPHAVIVVDEAGMVGTRALARLAAHAASAQAKLVLVGDPHQLPEIDAGGALRALATRLPPIELVDNRRQQQAWEHDALDELRHGDPDAALAAYQARGRVHAAESAEAAREQLVGDWFTAVGEHGQSGVMITARRSDADDLNRRARRRLAADGALTGPQLDVDGRVFQAGDRVVCLRNDRRAGVLNGTTATVTAVDLDTRSVQMTADGGGSVLVRAGYLDAGHLTHGYAITAHKAQGMTVDHAWVLGDDSVYREWGYVALSRHRASAHLYHVAADGRDATRDALRRRRSQQIGVDQAHPDTLDTIRSRQTSQQRRALADAHQQALSRLDDARERQRHARNALTALQGPLQRLRPRRRAAAQRELHAATSLVNEHTATVQRLDDARTALHQQELQRLWDKTTRQHDREAACERAAEISPTRADHAPDLGLAL